MGSDIANIRDVPNVKAFLDDQHTWFDEATGERNTVLESIAKGGEYYAAIEVRTREDEIMFVYPQITVYHKSGERFVWKHRRETFGTPYTNCPRSILELLSDVDQVSDDAYRSEEAKEEARKWRKHCWENVVSEEEKPDIREGIILHFESMFYPHGLPWNVFKAVRPEGKTRGWEWEAYAEGRSHAPYSRTGRFGLKGYTKTRFKEVPTDRIVLSPHWTQAGSNPPDKFDNPLVAQDFPDRIRATRDNGAESHVEMLKSIRWKLMERAHAEADKVLGDLKYHEDVFILPMLGMEYLVRWHTGRPKPEGKTLQNVVQAVKGSTGYDLHEGGSQCRLDILEYSPETDETHEYLRFALSYDIYNEHIIEDIMNDVPNLK